MADERLNALIVFASRADREEIETLLETLDSEQLPDILATRQPKVIPLQHAQATTVELQVRQLYATQLRAGGGRAPIEIPPGVNAEVATTIQQFNALSKGPLMTIDADVDTNSLLVVAPAQLMREVADFVSELDRAAAHPRRGVRIVPLQKVNGQGIDLMLRRALRSR